MTNIKPDNGMDPAVEGLEVVGEVRAKSDAYGGGTFVLWKQLPVAGMLLTNLASAQAAVQAAYQRGVLDERKKLEWLHEQQDDNDRLMKAMSDRNKEQTQRITQLEAVLNEWTSKTEWVQEYVASGKLPAKYLGHHRADVIADLITQLETVVAQAREALDLSLVTFEIPCLTYKTTVNAITAIDSLK